MYRALRSLTSGTTQSSIDMKAGNVSVNKRKLLRRIANNPASARFSEIVMLLEAFGFRLSRANGSHHIFVHTRVPRPVNIQDVHGEAKPYQVRQILKIVERYNLELEE